MSPGASQMVAVMMTDLVGSTAMAQRAGPEAAERLRTEHFGLLRGALESTAGQEVKNLGDGLMVVFDSAAQSLACAVQMQQAVEARNRRADEELGVRIGVSVGDTTVEDGDYFGEPVVESARLCAHAQGGQIIVNALVCQLAGSRDGHRFNSLGDLQLKGIAQSVQAYELEWAPAPTVGLALPERLRELPATAYVGRVGERERLASLWEQAVEGSLRLAMIGGEAGVGKTRLSTHLAHEAHGEGATVLYGRSDEDLGVPYQPWVQAIAHLVREAPNSVLAAHVEQCGGDLSRLVPALGDRVPDLPAPRGSDPETGRYLMYAAVSSFLGCAGDGAPLLLILDDLHWADAPSLSLLRHVVTAEPLRRVMVVCTYRDSDLSREHPLTPLLADLRREHGVERIKLAGLEADDVFRLMEAAAGQELNEDGRVLAEQITRETAGNPFFASEVLLHLTESGAIAKREDGRWRIVRDLAELGLPESVREVVGRRVERLGEGARTVLSAAAVIGREFEIELLTAVVDLAEGRVLDLLEEATTASLLQESSAGGRFTFAHGLVEHTLYEDLGSTRRARLHKRVGEALELRCGDEPGERLGELAGHWTAAVVSSDSTKAIHYARRAAERALQHLAPAEAARWYRQAIELHDQGPGVDDSERCELLIGLGEAQRQVGDADYRRTLLQAASLAADLGDADRLSRAVLANSRGWFSQAGAVDDERVAALEAAAEILIDRDSRRAQVLALLGDELHQSGDPDRCKLLATEAVEIARELDDLETLGLTLMHASTAISFPDMLPECEQMIEEVLQLADTLDDPSMRFRGASANMVVGLWRGDRARVEASLATERTLAASVPEPAFAFQRLMSESCWSAAQGELDAAERWAIQMYESGTASGQPDALTVFSAELFNVRYEQGRTGELVEQLALFAGRPNSVSISRAWAALALIESCREDEARELAVAEDLQSVRWGWLWLMSIFLWADVCSRLKLEARADELYELLTPFAGQLAVSGTLVAGSVDWSLGALATTAGRHDQAENHFAAAAAIEERFGAPLYVARTRTGWARALIARGWQADLERAEEMLEQAEDAAERLGGGLVNREAAECRAALAAMSG